MENTLQHIKLRNQNLVSGKILDINLSYQIFGPDLHSAPIILVNHALTGNSNVAGESGWWNSLIGENKIIDTNIYSVVCFNIPGNGFDGNLIEEENVFTTKDIANIFLKGLEFLNIAKLHTLIGGSIGGAIAWEMLAIKTNLANHFIPIACDFKTSDWLHAQCLVQQFLLDHKEDPLQKARLHAMLCYRTPASLNQRFRNEFDAEKQILKSHDWLNFHGKSLGERFSLSSYRLMNYLLISINADLEKLPEITANIHFIAVDSDLFFPAFEMKNCCEFLKKNKQNVFYHEVKSIHGHDAFLMEYEQLNHLLNNIFYEK
ncbi:alpha/beta fold hydrolase [Kaistella jeonii]|uniref:Homoserine acetyltransferase n=1 Tax=Kaistella jeonii TaxID=266749 RepID=A0A0C1FDB2_9FLAO|nr:alpha/beta fold hydrolase [Kaistella jeonii]KIA89818.1 homoserine acetyltransferase [Kaistella jeonii]SFB85641.1 homoserine O-acetyltransferase [Kaistella jeonii]VEI96054.1 Homoserine O-acetyltransferase [Kaistella jeonii]